MLLPGLATTIGAMMGGGEGADLSAGINAMSDFARALVEETLDGDQTDEGVAKKRKREAADEVIETHPMFVQFWKDRDALLGLNPVTD